MVWLHILLGPYWCDGECTTHALHPTTLYYTSLSSHLT